MKPAPGTISHRLRGIVAGEVVTLTSVLGQPLSCRADSEAMAHLLRAGTYPEALAEIRARYGAKAISSTYTTTHEQALTEAAKVRFEEAAA